MRDAKQLHQGRSSGSSTHTSGSQTVSILEVGVLSLCQAKGHSCTGEESLWAAVHGEGAGEEDSGPAESAEASVPERAPAGSAHHSQDGLHSWALACADASGRLLGQPGHPVKPSDTSPLIKQCVQCMGMEADAPQQAPQCAPRSGCALPAQWQKARAASVSALKYPQTA